ncbi:MAG TPA: PilN domain-containing protein [Acidobacteriaceae bacterium]|jgi:type IV pilus assembly protein PilN|nr:PilN domain-containing protein [Acidobacteriaceae bacterium]
MRLSINLATKPYLELGPVYKRLQLLIVALAVLAVPLWLLLRAENQKAEAAHARLEAAQQRLSILNNQNQQYQSDMRLPQNASVLRQSQFLNTLFEQKAFSWTAVMMDLERVLPAGVQVESIDPAIAKNGDVTIRLRVSGEHDRAVDLVRNLEHSDRFLLPRIADESAETNPQGGRGGLDQQAPGNGVNFDILADYNPLPETTAGTERRPATGKNAGSEAPLPGQPSKRHRAHPAAKTNRPSPIPAANPRLPIQKAGPR